MKERVCGLLAELLCDLVDCDYVSLLIEVEHLLRERRPRGAVDEAV